MTKTLEEYIAVLMQISQNRTLELNSKKLFMDEERRYFKQIFDSLHNLSSAIHHSKVLTINLTELS